MSQNPKPTLLICAIIGIISLLQMAKYWKVNQPSGHTAYTFQTTKNLFKLIGAVDAFKQLTLFGNIVCAPCLSSSNFIQH